MKKAILTISTLLVISMFPLVSSTTEATAAQQIRMYFEGRWQKYVPRNPHRPAYWLRVNGDRAWRSSGWLHTIVDGTARNKGRWMCVSFPADGSRGSGCLAKGSSPRVARMTHMRGDMRHK